MASSYQHGPSSMPLELLTGQGFAKALKALESNDRSKLAGFIFPQPDEKSFPSRPKDCMYSHRGPDTKKQLVEPLQRTMKKLYDIDGFVDSLPLNEYSTDHKANVLSQALWSCPRTVIFLSPDYHQSIWCLKELFTTLYRAKIDKSFVYTIVYCGGLDPAICKRCEAYSGLNLGKTWGTLQEWNLPFKDLVVSRLHAVVLRLVRGETAKLVSESVVSSTFEFFCAFQEPDLMYNVPPPLPYFEGRQDELSEVKKKLQVNQTAVVFPTGMGGAGKTQLVVRFVRQHRGDYGTIAWVSSEDEYSLLLDLSQLREPLKLPEVQDELLEDTAKRVVDAMATPPSITGRRRSLLVYDNAPSLDAIQKWIPRQGSPCHTIVTTRNCPYSNTVSRIRVGPLDVKSSFRVIDHLIERRLNADEKNQVLPMLNEFEFLPLAIVMFAQLVKNTGCVDDAISLVRHYKTKVFSEKLDLDLSYGSDKEGRESLWAVLRGQVQSLTDTDAPSLRLLLILCVLGPEKVPRPFLKVLVPNGMELLQAIKVLANRSMIQVDRKTGALSIHRLIQLNGLEYASKTELTELLETAGSTTVQYIEGLDLERGRSEQANHMLPHALALIKHCTNQPTSRYLGNLQHAVGQVFCDSMVDYNRALEHYNESLRIKQATYGRDHPSVAMTLHSIGSVFGAQGQYDRALEHYNESLHIKEAKYGRGHREVAKTLHNIGIVFHKQGQYDRALEHYNESLCIQQAKYGRDHPEVAMTLTCIGVVYQAQGQYDRALEHYNESLRIEQAKYGGDHPNVAKTLHNIGMVFEAQGQYDRALEHYNESLRIKQATYGRDHPEVATTLHNIGIVFDAQGQYNRALEHYNESLRIRQAKYGRDHPEVATTLHSIGSVFGAQGQYDRALEHYNESLRIYQATYNHDHPEVATTLHSIGMVFDDQGQYDRALEHYNQSLRIQQATYGRDHPEVSTTLHNIGIVFDRQGQYDRALEHYNESLRIEQAKYGRDHPKVAKTLHSIGIVFYGQGQYDRALEHYNESLRIEQATYGRDHPEVAMTLHTIGMVFYAQGQYDRALEQYQEALRMYTLFLPVDHPDRVRTEKRMKIVQQLCQRNKKRSRSGAF